MEIRKKMAKGAFWLFLEKGVQQVSSFVVFAIIARLIGPEEYGLVGLCAAVLNLLNTVILGAADGVVSLKIKDDARLSTIFWTMVTGGAALSGLMFCLSEPFALLFDIDKLAPLSRAFAILPFLYALSTVQTSFIIARMDFRVFTIRTFMGAVFGGGVGIYFACHGWGAYAIAAQQVASQAVIAIVVWFSCEWKPSLVWRKAGLREAAHLGFSQIGTRLVNFVEDGTPRFLLGYFIGPAAVGQFAFVNRICSATQDGIITPVLGILFPAFVEVQNDPEKKSKLFGQIVFLVGSCMIPVAAGLSITAPDFLPLFFGDKWTASIPLLQIFSLTTVFFPFGQINYNVLRAQKQTNLFLRFQIVFTSLSVLTYILLISQSLPIILGGRVAISFITTNILAIFVLKKAQLSLKNSYLKLFPALIATGIMVLAMSFFMELAVHPQNRFWALVVDVAFGFLAFAACFLVLQFKQIMRLWMRVFPRR